jgi:hypothetical protein
MPSNPVSSPSSSNNRPPSLSSSDKLFSSVFWSGKFVHSQQEQRPVHFNSALWQAQRLVEHPTSYQGQHKENPGYEVVKHPDKLQPQLAFSEFHQELPAWSFDSISYWLNLVPRVYLFAGYVVAWLWGNRIEIVIWLAAAIINVADTLMRVFCENYAWTCAKRKLSMLIRFGMRNQAIYSKDIIILIVWTSIGTLGIYLQNGIVFMNDFLSIRVWVYWHICMWKRRRTSFVFIPW